MHDNDSLWKGIPYELKCKGEIECYDKYPEPTPIIVDPTIPTTPTNPVVVTTKKCGVDKWYQHFKKSLNFKAAFAHLLGKHN